jgi:hypothetical protein
MLLLAVTLDSVMFVSIMSSPARNMDTPPPLPVRPHASFNQCLDLAALPPHCTVPSLKTTTLDVRDEAGQSASHAPLVAVLLLAVTLDSVMTLPVMVPSQSILMDTPPPPLSAHPHTHIQAAHGRHHAANTRYIHGTTHSHAPPSAELLPAVTLDSIMLVSVMSPFE